MSIASNLQFVSFKYTSFTQTIGKELIYFLSSA